jgi:uncharacterized protein (DUF1330 family)
MAAYVILNIDVTNPERFAEYVKVAAATVASYNGKYLARGGRAEKLEGSWEPKRFVVLEFPTLQCAKDWWASEEYLRPKALRQSASATDLIVVEGV